MRWLIGFVLVLAAVVAVRLVGCGETPGGDGGKAEPEALLVTSAPVEMVASEATTTPSRTW